MAFLVSILALLAPAQAVELREASLQYKSYKAGSRYPYMITAPTQGLNLIMNIDLGLGFYFDNRVVSNTDESQFRFVGWNFVLGLSVFPGLRVQFEHFSQHLMEQVNPHTRFPAEDSFGVVWTVYENRVEPRRSLYEHLRELVK